MLLVLPLQEHIYKLMKSDSYSRFLRSTTYQELLQAKKKVGCLRRMPVSDSFVAMLCHA